MWQGVREPNFLQNKRIPANVSSSIAKVTISKPLTDKQMLQELAPHSSAPRRLNHTWGRPFADPCAALRAASFSHSVDRMPPRVDPSPACSEPEPCLAPSPASFVTLCHAAVQVLL